jgi:hypothetical protein
MTLEEEVKALRESELQWANRYKILWLTVEVLNPPMKEGERNIFLKWEAEADEFYREEQTCLASTTHP